MSKARPCPKELKGLIGGKIKETLITSNWPDILRSVATMATGAMQPSQLLRKFAAYPRQHELAVALREIGRVERTLFIIDWLLDADMQRRARIGLNKGEAHHALKNALRIGRQGEIRDRTAEGQPFRMAGLNLLATNHHLLEHQTPRPSRRRATSRRSGLLTQPLGAHLAPRMGPYPAHWRLQVAKTIAECLMIRCCPLRHQTPVSGFRGPPHPDPGQARQAAARQPHLPASARQSATGSTASVVPRLRSDTAAEAWPSRMLSGTLQFWCSP